MPAFDAVRVLRSPPAMAALAGMVHALHGLDAGNAVVDDATEAERALSRLGLGLDADRRAAVASGLDDHGLQALLDAGAMDHHDGTLSPRFALYVDRREDGRRSTVLVPRDGGEDPARVYFGRDTMLLAALARQFGPGRGTAADLGTGAGAVALDLADAYDTVVATDLLARTAACAAITMALNPRADGRPPATACVADVAAGLRAGAFDLVVANPPWMPTHPDAAPRVFAEGGATGFELPRRFAVDAATLLAPGGTAIVLLLDLTWSNLSRPVHALARGLQRLGYDVAIHPTDPDATMWPELEPDLVARFEHIVAAEHVALLLHRRP